MTTESEVLAQAKKIMDEFMKALDKVIMTEKFGVVREQQVRESNLPAPDSTEFRKRIFRNAPKIKDDCFVMEKKKW